MDKSDYCLGPRSSARAAPGAVFPEKQVTAELVNGKVSITAQKLYLPCCCTPRRNRKSMLLPLVSGAASVIVVADILLLNPPPFGCVGGCSSVVPRTLVVPPPLNETTTEPDDRGRRSAVQLGAGNVVRSMMRKRSRLMAAPVEFVRRRRISTVPSVELLAGSALVLRT